eukprot:6178889-Pleurochrysis_carterae.AAC.1
MVIVSCVVVEVIVGLRIHPAHRVAWPSLFSVELSEQPVGMFVNLACLIGCWATRLEHGAHALGDRLFYVSGLPPTITRVKMRFQCDELGMLAGIA